MNRHVPLAPRQDYETVRAAIAYLSETPPDALDLTRFARGVGCSERQLTDLFQRWCGLSPKSFAQAVALEYARTLLRGSRSVLATANEVGLSSASRLHDLFVVHEAMPPGAFGAGGAGIDVSWGAAPSPFGIAVLATTAYGLAGIGFSDDAAGIETAAADLSGRWPAARMTRNDAAVAPLAAHVFDPARWRPDRPVRVVLIGTDFEVKVWETLLGIPFGSAASYGAVARRIGRPSAVRAVGAAVGRNPISFVVPCHRVVGVGGGLTGYHWGLPRKRAMLGWEAGRGGGP